MTLGVTASEKRLYQLCARSFLSYWSFPNPFRNDTGLAKELCDLLVVCDRYILVFSDKSIVFPEGDLLVAWNRWKKKAISGSAKQLLGAFRILQHPRPRIFDDRSLKERIRVSLPPLEDREIHLIAVANGATEASERYFNEPVPTLVMTNDRKEAQPFVIGDVGDERVFIHTFTDVSLELVLNELDTITDLTAYLRNRADFFRSPLHIGVNGEESLLPLYFRGYSEDQQNYDIMRALKKDDENLDGLWIDGDFWGDFIKRPEYLARKEQNEISYLWDRLIEKFARHQIDGTGTSSKPPDLAEHEGGMRYMALEPRVIRRSLSLQIMDAIDRFEDSGFFYARSFMPGKVRFNDNAYLFMQIVPPPTDSYEEYRKKRAHLLYLYSATLLFEQPSIARVIGIATEPPRIFLNKPISEDMILIDRKEIDPEHLEEAKQEKERLGLTQVKNRGEWKTTEFPQEDEPAK